MNVITALIAGLLAGWLIEWLIDWIVWRRREARLRSQLDRAYIKLGSADAASHALEHQLESLKSEHAALQTQYNSLAARIADTQPQTAVKKMGEEETWVETTPTAEWLPETLETQPTPEPVVSEPPAETILPEPPAVETPQPEPAAVEPSQSGPPAALIPPEPAVPAPATLTEAPLSPAEEAQPLPPAPATPGMPGELTETDNLRAIKGIGPAIDYKLRQAGINTFKDLAESSPERVADAIGNTFLRLVNVDALIEQARMLAAEKDGGGQA